METARLLVQYHGNTLYLKVLAGEVLTLTNYLLSDFIRPLLALFRVILSDILCFFMDYLIDYPLNRLLD